MTYKLSEDHLIALMLEEGTITPEDLLEWRMAEAARRMRKAFILSPQMATAIYNATRALNEFERALRLGMTSLSEARAKMKFPDS